MIILIFIIGYLFIAFEEKAKINKAAFAIVMGVVSWIIVGQQPQHNNAVMEHLANISSILFFLLGAMTIVELIDAHNGFSIITDKIKSKKTAHIIIIVSAITFVLSAVLDNLTATIVMISIVRKLVLQPYLRKYFAGLIVITANAGGAFSPIGDVTTTMLWVGGQISEWKVIQQVFIPSLICAAIPTAILCLTIKEQVTTPTPDKSDCGYDISKSQQLLILISGITLLLAVPVLKAIFHVPPFLGILLGLGILWIITEIIHGKLDERESKTLSVAHALRMIDTPSILFFLGILLSIAALETNGDLHYAASGLMAAIPNTNISVTILGVLSAIIDNVPLVAAVQGMFDLSTYPKDSFFWHLLAFSTGTGGSLLVIGSAAGVTAMGIEQLDFIWYLKKISWLALLGFIAGVLYMCAVQ